MAIGPFPKLFAGIHERSIFWDRYVCLVRTEHPAIDGSISISQFKQSHHILWSARNLGHVQELISAHENHTKGKHPANHRKFSNGGTAVSGVKQHRNTACRRGESSGRSGSTTDFRSTHGVTSIRRQTILAREVSLRSRSHLVAQYHLRRISKELTALLSTGTDSKKIASICR